MKTVDTDSLLVALKSQIGKPIRGIWYHEPDRAMSYQIGNLYIEQIRDEYLWSNDVSLEHERSYSHLVGDTLLRVTNNERVPSAIYLEPSDRLNDRLPILLTGTTHRIRWDDRQEYRPGVWDTKTGVEDFRSYFPDKEVRRVHLINPLGIEIQVGEVQINIQYSERNYSPLQVHTLFLNMAAHSGQKVSGVGIDTGNADEVVLILGNINRQIRIPWKTDEFASVHSMWNLEDDSAAVSFVRGHLGSDILRFQAKQRLIPEVIDELECEETADMLREYAEYHLLEGLEKSVIADLYANEEWI